MGQGKKSNAKPLDDEQRKQLSDAHNQVDNLAPPVNGYDASQANDRLVVISFSQMQRFARGYQGEVKCGTASLQFVQWQKAA